jgi:hypothetical protein
MSRVFACLGFALVVVLVAAACSEPSGPQLGQVAGPLAQLNCDDVIGGTGSLFITTSPTTTTAVDNDGTLQQRLRGVSASVWRDNPNIAGVQKLCDETDEPIAWTTTPTTQVRCYFPPFNQCSLFSPTMYSIAVHVPLNAPVGTGKVIATVLGSGRADTTFVPIVQ